MSDKHDHKVILAQGIALFLLCLGVGSCVYLVELAGAVK